MGAQDAHPDKHGGMGPSSNDKAFEEPSIYRSHDDICDYRAYDCQCDTRHNGMPYGPTNVCDVSFAESRDNAAESSDSDTVENIVSIDGHTITEPVLLYHQ